MKRKNAKQQGMRLDATVCRVCLCAKGTVALFDERGTDEQFYYCTLLKVTVDDGLPDKLCRSCTENMRVAYDFRFQAIYAEKCFRKTIFLPALGQSESDGGGGDEESYLTLAADSEQVLVLNEPMQEIDVLLTKAQRGVVQEEEGKECQNIKMEESGENSVPEELSDHVLSDAENDALDIKFEETCEAEVLTKAEVLAEGISSSNESNLHPPLLADTLSGSKAVSAKTVQSGANNKCSSTTDVGTSFDCRDVGTKKNAKKSKARLKKLNKRSKTIKIECNICGNTFSQMSSLKQHVLMHSGERPFRCEFCGKTFTRTTVLNIHRRLHTGDRPYRCNECVQSFVTREALNRHKEHEHREGASLDPDAKSSYTCSVCDTLVYSERALKLHMRCHESSLINCYVCQRTFPGKPELLEHQREHEKEIRFECTACHCHFEKKFQLICHLQEHENSEVLIEKYVRVKTLKRPELEEMETDIADRTYNSDEDDKPLAERLQRSKHAKRKQKRTLKSDIWKCRVCGHRVPLLAELKLHMRSHAGDRPFKCSICGKAFSKKQNLSLHSRLHANNTDKTVFFHCELCQLQLKGKYKWHFHMQLHKASSDGYTCKKCGEHFSLKDLLMRHVKRVHFGRANLDYQCPQCSEALYDMRDLKQHLHATHAVPFDIDALNACDLCGVDCKVALEYYRHMHECHDAINKSCDECGEYFNSRRAFDKHVYVHYV